MNINSRTSKINFTGFASGAIASFTGLRAAPIIVRSQINAIQQGSGDPAPDNIRPINGWSECNVVDMSDITNIDYFQGLLNGTYGYINLGDLTWTSETTQVEGEYRLRSTGISSIVKRVAANNLVANIICPNYDATSSNAIYQSNTKGIAINTNGYIFVYDEDYSTSTSYTDFKTAMNGVYLIYELAAATTPTITAEQFNSLLTAFEIGGCCVNIVLGDTYYGGSLDVTTGVLTMDTARILFNTPTTFYQSGYAAYKELDGAFISDSYGYSMCDSYNFGTWTETTADGVNSRFTIYKHTNWIKPRLAFSLNGKTLNQFMNSLSSEPIDLIYKLATPITVQLTPTEISQIIGSNSIFSDTGNVEVYYVTI